MIDIAKLRVGDKVHYAPFDGCDPSYIENGMVKEVPENSIIAVRVVYNCAGEWEKFMNYTGALTSITQLRKGWYHGV